MDRSAECANITDAGRRRRRLSGWAASIAGAIVVAGLASRNAAPAAYLVVFPFAFGGAVGFLQARRRTCVVLGFRGTAEVEGGGVRRLEDATRERARAQAKSVLRRSLAIAAAVTLAIAIASGISIRTG